jgi:hypothetical protein
MARYERCSTISGGKPAACVHATLATLSWWQCAGSSRCGTLLQHPWAALGALWQVVRLCQVVIHAALGCTTALDVSTFVNVVPVQLVVCMAAVVAMAMLSGMARGSVRHFLTQHSRPFGGVAVVCVWCARVGQRALHYCVSTPTAWCLSFTIFPL